MITGPFLVAIAVCAVSTSLSGVVLLRRARAAGSLLVASGLVAMLAVGLAVAGWTAAVSTLLALALAVFLPLALTAYPRWSGADLVDTLSVAGFVAAGTVSTVSVGYDTDTVLAAGGLTTGVTLFAHTWWRLEHRSERERRAVQWMALAVAVVVVVCGVVSFSTEDETVVAMTLTSLALVGPALVLGVRAPDVVDVRGLVVQVVVLAVTVLAYLALFVALASALQLTLARPPGVAAYAVVGAVTAVAFEPLRVLLRGAVDEVLFGTRPDPLGAASQVAGRMGEDPGVALRAIREALVLPHARIVADGTVLASSGAAMTRTRTFALRGAGADLVVALRPGDLDLSTSDRHVLTLIQPLLAQILRARVLTVDLQQSRGLLVSALEEERRRLRRDLHDGLGPRLSGIAYTSDAARNLLGTDPGAAGGLLESIRAETMVAIEDVRGLVYGMRPAALDELGLVPALRQHARALRRPDGGALDVEVVAPALPTLTAAVEVAAYRIVVEALANTAGHSDSPVATVRLAVLDGRLRVEVRDTGRSGEVWRPGVGMASMSERAAELGGETTAEPTARGGLVVASLPLLATAMRRL